MIDWLIILWLIIFVIFLAVNLGADSSVFGIVAGMWILVLGAFIIVSGVQIMDGYDIETVDSSTTVEYSYVDVTTPYSDASFLWGIFLICIGIFMIFSNAEDFL